MAKGKESGAPAGSQRETGSADEDFQGEFGDFHVARAVRMRCGPSPNGHYVGMRFELASGEVVKISVPIAHAHEFGSAYDAAVKSATERMEQNYDDPAGIA
jgi:hypothetical protein